MEIKEIIASITDTEIEQNNKFWRAVTPTTPEQIQNCYVFAFLSIQQSWERNVRGFDVWGNGKILKIVNAVLTTPDTDENKPALVRAMHAMIDAARSGLQVNRQKAVVSLCNVVNGNPALLVKNETQTWEKYRKTVIGNICMLGMAKSSFVAELLYPETSEIICIDSRMKGMFGLKNVGIGKRKYRQLELQWKAECTTRGVAPAIARHIIWSRQNPAGNCSDWANCLDFTGQAAKEAFN